MLSLQPGDTVPYSSYSRIYHGQINNRDIYLTGYNRWKDSACRQWLNSAESAGNWWSPAHFGDTAPDQASTLDGFLAGLDEDFLAVIQNVKIKTVTNNTTDGGVTDETFDKFWLPSLEEVYGVPQVADVEGPVFPYWRTVIGTNTPTNQTSNARKVKALDAQTSTSSVNTRLRSSYVGSTASTWYNLTGSISTGNTANTMRYQPACVLC